MGIQTAATDHISAGRGQSQFASTGGHGTGQQNGRADAAANIRFKIGWPDNCGLNTPGMVSDLFDTYHQTFQKGAHGLYITDIRNIVQNYRLVSQEAGSQQRESCVLIAGGSNFT